MFKTQFCKNLSIYIYNINNPIKPTRPQQRILPDWIKPSASTVRKTCGMLWIRDFPPKTMNFLPFYPSCGSAQAATIAMITTNMPIKFAGVHCLGPHTWPTSAGQCSSPEKLTAGDICWICRIIYMLHISRHIWHTCHRHIDLIPPPHLVKNRLEHSCRCNRARTTYPSTP